MNLDELKELEAKATPGELYLSETVEGNIYVYSKRHGRRYPETIPEKELVVALRNSAKEIFSTIERYKAGLEGLVGRVESYGDRVLLKSQFYIDAKEALKEADAVKAGAGNGLNMTPREKHLRIALSQAKQTFNDIDCSVDTRLADKGMEDAEKAKQEADLMEAGPSEEDREMLELILERPYEMSYGQTEWCHRELKKYMGIE